jgi:nitrite reductase/ring-hydroxylating ferredoxin subunit
MSAVVNPPPLAGGGGPTGPEAGRGETVRVARLDEIPDRGMKTVRMAKREVLLCRLGERVFALPSRCTHRGAPLLEGHLEGPFLRCPWHGARFDVRTGARVNAPDCTDVPVTRAEVRDGSVWLPA